MKRTDLPEADSQLPPDSDGVPPPTPPPAPGGWLTASDEAERSESNKNDLFEPLRRSVGRLSASWRYVADPAERHALLQFARGAITRLAESFRHPGMAARMESGPGQSVLPAALSEPDPQPPFEPEAALARLRSALRQLPEKGDVVVPGNLQSLDRLLGDTPPAMDFEAADLLHDCFPRGTRHSGNRVLLAVARNLTRNFGRPGRLPMTSGKAWTMLDPAVFVDQMAAQLAEISDFVLNWQAQEKSFLILEFAEVELIEYMFEHLHPRRHGALLIKVMEFKVLSTRRAGLLRRIPARVRRFIQHTAGAAPSVPLAYARDSANLLELIEKRVFFRPVVEAAAAARAEVEKVISRLAPAESDEPGRLEPPAADPAGKPNLGSIMQALGASAETSPASPPGMVPPERISAAPIAPPPVQTVSVSAPPLAAGLPVPAVPLRKRFSNRQKTESVMRILAGENRAQVAASMGAPPELVDRWMDSFLNGGAAALTPKKAAAQKRKATPKAAVPVDAASIDDLKAKLQSLLQTVEVLSDQIQSLPSEQPSKPEIPALPPPPPQELKPPPIPATSESLPPGFPAEDPNPPPRLKRSRSPKRYGTDHM